MKVFKSLKAKGCAARRVRGLGMWLQWGGIRFVP